MEKKDEGRRSNYHLGCFFSFGCYMMACGIPIPLGLLSALPLLLGKGKGWGTKNFRP